MKIKKKYLNSAILILIFIILFSKNHLSADYEAYLKLYNNSLFTSYNSGIEPLFLFLNKLGCLLHLSYNQFLVIFSLCGILLIFSTVNKYTIYVDSTLFAYFFFPFFDDVIQVRNFFAYAIVIYGVRYLIGNKVSYMKYILCVILACGFHKLTIIYLLFLLVKFDIRYIKKLVLISIPILLFLFKSTTLFINLLLGLGEKYSTYLNGNELKSMNFLVAFLISMLIFGSYIIINIIYSSKNRNRTVNDYDTFILKISLITLIFIPLIIFLGNNFYRIFRNLIILFYICFSNYTVKADNNTHTVLKLGTKCYPIFLLIFMGNIETGLIPILQSLFM